MSTGWALLLIVGLPGLLLVVPFVTPTLRSKAERKRLRTMPIADLAAMAQDAVRRQDWASLPEAQLLQSGSAWTEQALLESLDALWSAVIEQDKQLGHSGRESNYFAFYDAGLASISEALRDRLRIQQPWERRK